MNYKTSINYQMLSLILIVVGVYYPAIFAPINSLDDMKMINSLLNMDGFSFKHILLPNSYGQYYRPLLYLTFIADKYIWGLEASFMHLENILLHLGSSLLVFWLTRQVLSSLSLKAPFAPLVAALLFGLHPIATEPVNWISGRTDLMAGFFVLLALLLLLQSQKRSSYWRGIIGALVLLCGCLSKETALFILPVILVWCAFPPKDTLLHPLPELILEGKGNKHAIYLRFFLFTTYGAAGVIYLILRLLALSGGDKIVKTVVKVSAASSSTTVVSVGVFDVARVAAKAAGFYFKKLIIPVPLNFGINGISPHYFWLGLLVLCGVAWCMYRRDTVSYLFLAAFMLTSSAFILPILKITWTPIAERYAYMASAPFVIAIVILFVKYGAVHVSPRLATLVVAAVLGSAAIVTAQRNIIWQDNFTLFEDTVKKSPDFGAIKNEYAIALRSRGRTEEADKIMLSNAVDEFQPSSLNIIRIMTNQGKQEEARALLLERLKKPGEYDQMSWELLVSIDHSRRDKANTDKDKQTIDRDIIAGLQKLAKITGDPFNHYRLGMVQLRLGDKPAAKASFEKAWLGSPANSHYRDAARKLADRL